MVEMGPSPDLQIQHRKTDTFVRCDAEDVDIVRICQPASTIDGVRCKAIVIAGKDDHRQRCIGQHPRRSIDKLEGHAVVVEDITGQQEDTSSGLMCRADYLPEGVQIIAAVVEAEVQIGTVNQDEIVRGTQSAVLASQSGCLCSV